MSPKVLVCAITAAAGTLLLTPAGVLAAKQTCLTGTDPSVANDLSEITAARAAIDAACPCASPGQTHAQYVTCAGGVISAQVSAGNLRTQCKATLRTYYSHSTCGVSASQGDVPCIKTSAQGKVTCAIKSTAKCKGNACPAFTTCIDAADTNGDGIIGKGDSGACASSVAPAATPTFTVTSAPPTATFTPAPRFVDNGDGTITDTQTGLMWEKKDQSGGLDDVRNFYLWAGDCSDGSGLCQPDNSAASLCASQTGTTLSCRPCAAPATCNTSGYTTIWHWLAQLNAAGFAGYSDWQIPTVGRDGWEAELETILSATYQHCTTVPCVAPVFNTGCTAGCTVTSCSCTASFDYWSAITYDGRPQDAWDVNFDDGGVYSGNKHKFNNGFIFVRAVR